MDLHFHGPVLEWNADSGLLGGSDDDDSGLTERQSSDDSEGLSTETEESDSSSRRLGPLLGILAVVGIALALRRFRGGGSADTQTELDFDEPETVNAD